MQAKLHRWAVADPGRRFDDLFNFVHDPATLREAYWRVAGTDQPQAPAELRAALRTIDQHIGTYITRARLSAAA